MRMRGHRLFVSPIVRAATLSVLSLLLGWSALWGARERAIYLSREDLTHGFATVAAERLDRHKDALTETEQGCELLTTVLIRSSLSDRLAWAAENCLRNGIETPPVFMALADALEQHKHENEAISLLSQVSAKFPQSAEIHLYFGRLLARTRHIEDAQEEVLKAVQTATEDQTFVLIEALQFLNERKAVTEALAVARRLQQKKPDSPEIQLMIAQALLHGDDPSEGMRIADAIRKLAAEKPGRYDGLLGKYPDLFPDRKPASSPHHLPR